MDPNTEARCPPPDEGELIARIIAGDSSLFHEQVRPYERHAYLVAFSVLLHPANAEEVVHEAFISAYRGIKNFHGDERFGHWLFRLIVNLAKSRQ